MKKLLNYYIKKRWHTTFIITLILSLFVFINYYDAYFILDYGDGKLRAMNDPVNTFIIFASLLCTLIPIVEFKFKMDKISIDQMYSLPVKREKLYLAKYIFGLLEIVIPITISYLLCFIMIITQDNIFVLIHFLTFYLALLGCILLLYTTISFIFTRTNTTLDGIINIFAYIFVLLPVVSLIFDMFNVSLKDGDPSWFFLYSPMTRTSVLFSSLISNETVEYISMDLTMYITFTVIGILSFILFVILNKKEKAENSTQISNSFFSYRTLIPLYYISLTIILMKEATDIIIFFLLTVTLYTAYTIYKRTIKLKKRDYIILILCVVIGIISGLIYDAIF